jgi:exopolyphosphatase/guanosine-5'-triphosphate,3'-diphosphate pyrophosphatase
VVATAAVRRAGNRDLVLDHVRRHAGVEVEVLDGDEEARLAFLGASRTLGHEPAGLLAVLDVGGGSAEIAVGTPRGGVTWSYSYPIGSGVLSEAHPFGDPPTEADLAAMRAHAEEALATPAPPRPAEAVAVGGTATSLCRMGGAVLDEASLQRASRLVRSLPAVEIAGRFGLDVERARLLPAGILILDAAVCRIGRPLQVGRGGLREGVCLALAGHD